MVVNSLRDCWAKLSSRIRDYLDAEGDRHRHQKYASRPGSRKLHQNHLKDKHDIRSSYFHSLNQSIKQQTSLSNHRAPPNGFVKRKTSQGQVYFLGPNGHKSWYDPRVPKELLCSKFNLDELIGKLSVAWEVRYTPSGRVYYVNHRKKTTQFTDPRLVACRDYLLQVLRRSYEFNSHDTSTLPTASTTHYGTNHQTNVNLQPIQSNTITLKQNPVTPQSHHVSPNRMQPLSSSHHNLSTIYSSPNAHGGTLIDLRIPQRSTPRFSPHTNHQNATLCSTLRPNNSHRRHQHKDQSTNASLQNIFTASSIKPIFNLQSQNEANNKGLSDKITMLRQGMLKLQVMSGSCRVDVNRKKIFEESFRQISQMHPKDLKKRLLVKFRGEEGLDYGGVAREWFYLLSREMLNPLYGLFQYTSDDIYNFQINPDSGIATREHLSYMNFCGRILGMAVFHGHFIEGRFTLPFYKMLLGKTISLKDIEFVDPELHQSLCWMLSNNITGVLDTTFLVQHNAFGELQEHELKENGADIAVTEENKHEYVSLYVNYRCRRGIQSQFESLQRGFFELVPPHLLANFNEFELELLIGGLSRIDVEDWKANTKLKNCTPETPLVKWFWDIVKSYSEDKRARLLQFVTGSSRVPIQGFKALQGINSDFRLFTIHLIRAANTDNLPKAHTCFNRIDVPPYETFDKLKDKLTQAIEETIGFAMQ